MKLIAISGLLLLSATAWANVGEEYGFGSQTAALGGAGVAWGFNTFAAYSNPAALSMPSDHRFHMDYALLYMGPNLTPINNIVIQNNSNSSASAGSPVYGNVNLAYRPTVGQAVSFSYDMLPEKRHLTMGLVVYLPLNEIAAMDSGDPYIPDYFLYRSRTQRPQFEFGVGGEIGNGFHAGVGAHIGFGLTANANIFLATSATANSQMQFVGVLEPKASPNFSAFYAPPDDPERFSVGAVIRFPQACSNTMIMSAQTTALSAPVTLNFDANSTLYYDPLTFEVGTSVRNFGFGRTYVKLTTKRGALTSPLRWRSAPAV